jgi:hypothetical protein
MAISPVSNGVTLDGFYHEHSIYTLKLNSAVVAADVGKAMSMDGANQVKLAADNDVIVGRLESVEDRVQEGIKVGAVAFTGCFRLPVKSGETVVVGGGVQGAGSGEIKPLAAQTDTDGTGTPAIKNASHDWSNMVMEVGSGYAIVMLK